MATVMLPVRALAASRGRRAGDEQRAAAGLGQAGRGRLDLAGPHAD